MPHINIEYNDAIGKALNMKALIADLHDCAMSLEALPTGGIRTRGYLTDWTWKKNNIHQILKDKNNAPK